MSCSGLVLVSTLCCTQWLWDALHLHCYGKQDWLHQNNVISLDKYLNCWLNDPVHRKQTMCLVWLFLFCIKRTLEVATLMFDIRPYQSWSTMEKVFSIKLNAYLAQRCKRYLIFFFTFLRFTDHLLRGQKLPGPFLWVQKWLQRPSRLPQSLQFYQSGGRILGNLWETKLHGLPVCAEPWRVPGLPVLAG